MFTVALVTIVRLYNQPTRTPINKLIKKESNIHNEYYSDKEEWNPVLCSGMDGT